MNSCPEWFRYEIIWVKSKKTDFLNAEHKPLAAHENILIFSPATLRNHTYNPQTRFTKPYRNVRKVSTKTTNYGKADKPSVTDTKMSQPTTILWVPTDDSYEVFETEHPTKKPLALWRYLIHTYSNPGELVLDSCMGTGTIIQACMTSEDAIDIVGWSDARDYIGIEKSRTYFELASKRRRTCMSIEKATRDILGSYGQLSKRQILGLAQHELMLAHTAVFNAVTVDAPAEEKGRARIAAIKVFKQKYKAFLQASEDIKG